MTARILVKLGLLTILPLVVAAVFVLLMVSEITVGNLEEMLEESLREKAYLVETSLQGESPEAFQGHVPDLARRAEARVTVVDPVGRVLADSEADPTQMENHANRAEFIASLQGTTAVSRRRSSTLSKEFLYVAVPMARGGAVRLALPLDQVEALAASNRNSIAAVIVLVVVPLVLITTWSARRISSQISGIVSMSNRIAEGDFEVGSSPSKAGDLSELNELTSSLQTTARKLRSTFSQLQQERSRFAAAVNGIGEGILVSDRKRRVVLFNPAVERMFPDENLAINRSIRKWKNRQVPAILRETIRRGKPRSTEISVDEPARRLWRVSCAPIVSRKGKIQAVAAVFHDITELERIDQMRRDFVINVSHELRTPLASITGYAETLLDGALHDATNNERFVRILWRNAQRLSDLTSDLMTLSQIEVNAREFDFQPHPVSTLLATAAEGIRPVLERRDLELEVSEAWQELQVECDQSAVQQILANLLDNAAKYTPRGGRISVGAIAKEAQIEVFVRDTGIGIAAEHRPRLFERFYRVDKARSRELGGTGLGLAIVKHLAQAHGGSAWVESALGEGSTFWFSLPFDRGDQKAGLNELQSRVSREWTGS